MALTIGLVLATELINTAIETLADHLHPQRHEAIRVTKDVAAAAVLVSSTVALLVAAAFVVDQVLPMLGMSLPIKP
jgi:diacylglycerol kinase (ATP)